LALAVVASRDCRATLRAIAHEPGRFSLTSHRSRVQFVNVVMERQGQRELEILTAIGEGRPLTQRDLSRRLGVALGLTNLYLKRLARKGLIKITEFPRKPGPGQRLRYVLTGKGFSEKTRLSCAYIVHSLELYRRAREALRERLGQLSEGGIKRVALYGTGEAAELAYLTLREFGLEPVGVFAKDGGGHFLGFPVQAIDELRAAEADGVVLATFEPPEPEVAELVRLGFPASRILTLFPPMPPASGNEHP
jgi:DNA-binding MarR family transcriptional regulator